MRRLAPGGGAYPEHGPRADLTRRPDAPDMRALDVLNAFQQFPPFESLDGEFEIVAKATIARIKPFDKPKQPRRRAGEKAGHLAPVD